MEIRNCLTIAGSDPSGGAGIQADLKTFTVLGTYGMAALTALTAQNTAEVRDVFPIPPDFVRMQLETILDDIPCHAAKTGMLANAEIIQAVTEVLSARSVDNLVADPVMVSTSGGRLLTEDSIEAVRTLLLPISLIATPNAKEAEVLVGHSITGVDDMKRAAESIHKMGAKNVLIKGGDMADTRDVIYDVLFDGSMHHVFDSRRITTNHTHGSGCTMAAAICTYLAQGHVVLTAVTHARDFVYQCIANALPIGKGNGPVNQLCHLQTRIR